MFMFKALLAATFFLVAQNTMAQESRFGKPATKADIDKSFWTVFPDGEFLPDGEGNATEGRELFEYNCNICHNFPDENDPTKTEIGKLFGGKETLGSEDIDRLTISYWPYSTTVFDYIRRSMPLLSPMSLTNNEYYSLTAYLLYENDIIAENDVMNKETLPKVKMPNRDSFLNVYPQVPDKYQAKP